MFKKIATVFGLAALLAVPSAHVVDAQPALTGQADVQFNLGWPGPNPSIPVWIGTITLDEVEYGMAFFNTGTGKPFAEHPSDNGFFEETWVIYEQLTFSFDASGALDVFDPGEVVLSGYDRGITTLVNSKYRMNGTVDVAQAPFADWLGATVHMQGEIAWYDFGAPHFARGPVRLN